MHNTSKIKKMTDISIKDTRTDRDILIGIEHAVKHLSDDVGEIKADQALMWLRHKEHNDALANVDKFAAVEKVRYEALETEVRDNKDAIMRAIYGGYAIMASILVALVVKYLLFFGGP